MATTSDIRKGLCIKYNNDIYKIVDFLHVKPGKGPAFVRTKLKSITSGRVIDFKREDKKVIFKEMALMKIVGKESKRGKAIKICKKHNAIILDKTKKSVVIQVTALRREIDMMTKNLKKLGLVSVSRTGAVAMTRGAEIFK